MGKKNRVKLNEHNISDTADDFADLSIDMKENLRDFINKFRIEIVKYDEEKFEFDLISVSPAIANAIRRVLISDVPTMAIDRVHMMNNTSLMQDEVLAHRLGLIPLKADPRLFEYRTEGEENEGSDQDSLQFELKIKCTRNPSAGTDKTLPDDLYVEHKVYSKHLKWIPIGGQEDLYKEEEIGPIHDDILIMKLRPGHEIDLKAFAYKGVGKEHAKFSPVATAHYRQLPEIKLLRPVTGEQATRLQTCFSPGVIGIKKGARGQDEAYVMDARYDSSSRNVFRYDDLKDSVEMTRVPDHFIFSIESTGALSPDILFIEALKTLKKKCKEVMDQIG